MQDQQEEEEHVTICITPKDTPSSPVQLQELWTSIMDDPEKIAECLKQYTVKTLVHFAHYYGLACPKKINKETLLVFLHNFESNPIHHAVVERRKQMWQAIGELKTDPYFSKFVLYNLLA